ncbi:MAG: hypothetical protein H0U53_09800 [Actinobacteria bacterium]|nr:hypothetical protein [Actinomycetota bacterium]
MGPWIIFGAFVGGMIDLVRFLARRDREWNWDKEGFGQNRSEPGVHYRPLEVPPNPPFD